MARIGSSGSLSAPTGDVSATGQDRVDPGRDEHRRDLGGLLYAH